jgi:phosphoribosylformimino-5-aminoimidazole carboxamide ribonucleotide (ProFAR) isomerase
MLTNIRSARFLLSFCIHRVDRESKAVNDFDLSAEHCSYCNRIVIDLTQDNQHSVVHQWSKSTELDYFIDLHRLFSTELELVPPTLLHTQFVHNGIV